MLPPQLHGGLSSSARHRSLINTSSVLHQASSAHFIRAAVAHPQSRTCWFKRRWDWASPLDPSYHHFHRFHTLKTRAKLLDKLRRRRQFDWDCNQRPFFTPRNIRLASHWNGGRPFKAAQARQDAAAEDEAEGDGYELSQREKEWKEQMEAMRKRIQHDPYEAVFGKRFEPFWSPLVPSWMREEMGLQGWPKREQQQQQQQQKERAMEKPKTTPPETESSFVKLRQTLGEKIAKAVEREQDTVLPAKEESGGQTSSYSYSSSTSWDSWTNKTRRTEWDSISGRTKRFEYDPITNRMVQIEGPKAEESKEAKQVESHSPVEVSQKPSQDMQTLINTPATLKPDESKAVDIPVKKSTELRQPIPIPPQALEPVNKIPVGFASASPVETTTNTAVSANGAQPAAPAKLPENDLDLLTADVLRASMGKTKQTTHPPSAPAKKPEPRGLEKSSDAKSYIETHAVLQERESANSRPRHKTGADRMSGEWDKAELSVMLDRELESLTRKKAKLLKDEHGLFHIERQKRELVKLDERMNDVGARMEKLNAGSALSQSDDVREMKGRDDADVEKAIGNMFSRHDYEVVQDLRMKGFTWAEISRQMLKQDRLSDEKKTERLMTSLDRAAAGPAKDTSAALQPAVERMQVKDELVELDDSAAHESTEPLEGFSAIPPSTTTTRTNVPKDWDKAAEMLQADRVKRSASKRPYPMTRWIDDMRARKAVFEASKGQVTPPAAEQTAAPDEKTARLEKANALLESEIKEQKFRMQAHENRYAHKLRSLRTELDMAYKQSAVHGEKHVERIRWLEGELEKVKKVVGDGDGGVNGRGRGGKKVEMMQAEGDFCVNVVEYARGSERWYKQPCSSSSSHSAGVAPVNLAPLKREVEKAEQRAKDQALVREVRDIYEREYGVIDTEHRQPVTVGSASAASDSEAKPAAVVTTTTTTPATGTSKPQTPTQRQTQVVEVESDVDLGEALAEHEKEMQRGYRFKEDGLEAELAAPAKAVREAEMAAREKEAHEAQYQPEVIRVAATIAKNMKMNEERRLSQGPKLVDDNMPRLIPTELANNRPTETEMSKGEESAQPADKADKAVEPVSPGVVQWADPPVYKVLAYDSGNDAFSTATTTSNFTGAETPISIPQALSQLYQPARFVPHFAALQQEGYQVIYGTRDLLVFKKVKAPAVPKQDSSDVVGVADHGLVRPRENAYAAEAAESYERQGISEKVKEYDPISIENGTLMPYENALAQEAAENHDQLSVMATERKRMKGLYDLTNVENRKLMCYEAALAREAAEYYDGLNNDAINPVDGTAARKQQEHGVSPRSLDDLTVMSNPESSTQAQTLPPPPQQEGERSIMQDEDVDYVHYPRVKREERVFSGTKRTWSSRHERHQRKRDEMLGRRRRGGALRWALGTGLGAAAVTYFVGAAAERSRREKRQRERWEEILEGKRARWE